MKCRLWSALLLLGCSLVTPAWALQHYLYIYNRGNDSHRLQNDTALQDPRFAGAQVVYSWRQLEPEPGHYDFTAIRADLKYLASQHKQLWIQLQDKSFSPTPNIPDYLFRDVRYQGGALKQSLLSAPERQPGKAPEADEYGWVPKMWEPTVRQRFQLLIAALGQEFDGKVTGINFNESSLEIGTEHPDGTESFPTGFTPDAYVAAIEENMTALAGAFHHSTPMVYLNFLPGEWLPWNDKGYMKRLFRHAEKLKMGVGGPDLMPYRKAHMTQSYAFFHAYPDTLIKGMAVQEGNLRQINPRTGKKNSVADTLTFARDYLGLDYIFWVEDEPYFSREVLKELPATP